MLKIKTSASHSAERRSNQRTARPKGPGFGQVIRRRRRELNLTQDQVAARIETSTPYVGQLESSRRHPSDLIVERLADALGLDKRELFLLANPHTAALLTTEPAKPGESVSVLDQFKTNEQLRRIHNVSNDEMHLLSQVGLLGGVQTTRDVLYILNTVRHVVGR